MLQLIMLCYFLEQCSRKSCFVVTNHLFDNAGLHELRCNPRFDHKEDEFYNHHGIARSKVILGLLTKAENLGVGIVIRAQLSIEPCAQAQFMNHFSPTSVGIPSLWDAHP